MAKIEALLKSFKDEMKELGLEGVHATPVPPRPRKRIEGLEKKYKFALPAPLKEYYLQTNGHFISWSLPQSDIAGTSSAFDVESFFANRTTAFREGRLQDGVPYYSAYLDEEQKRVLEEEYFVFERAYVDSFVLVSKKESGEDAALYLLEYPFALTKLDLGFEAYLSELFRNKALLNWQQKHKQRDKDRALIAKVDADAKALLSHGKAKPRARKGRAPAYRRRLDELLKRLESNEKIAPVQFRGYSPPPVNVFRKIEKTFGSELPEEVVRFYSEVNGFTLIWRTKPEATPQASGYIDIPPLERAFGGDHYAATVDWDDYVTYGVLWDDELREAFTDDFRGVQNKRIFDRHLARTQVLMEPADGEVNFFYYIDRGVIELGVGFAELSDTLFGTAGVEYYPELLRKPRGGGDRKFIEGLLEKVKVVNPDFSLKGR